MLKDQIKQGVSSEDIDTDQGSESEQGTQAAGSATQNAYFDKLATLLQVHAHGESGQLFFKAKAKLSPEDEKLLLSFLNSLQIGFNEFKEKLRMQGVSIKQFTSELKDNMLAIKVPSLAYYGAFIRHLVQKSLLPSFALDQQKKAIPPEPERAPSLRPRPTPFSTKLKPRE